MFVSKRRWILKTCGTTTPLQCLGPLLQLASQLAGHDSVQELFYSRKNFKRPEMQRSPHRGFDEEVALLDSHFDDGRAYCMGSLNRDCWYVYTLSRRRDDHHRLVEHRSGSAATPMLQRQLSDVVMSDDTSAMCEAPRGSICSTLSSGSASGAEDDDGELSCNSNDSGCGGGGGGGGATDADGGDFIVDLSPPEAGDQTIEILMTELDPNVMALFTKRECADAKAATERSGIHKLLPGMLIDDYLFEPCGYSMNGVGRDNVSRLRGLLCIFLALQP